ncbi:hypothetical protein B14911_27030 [Bacillus sp. NRRL B-14911]|uniref:Uncharacterized protein n=1 Tax=Bacillus infantis NRRL B-14911 TaxID=1367477 RepID=U5LCU2_9BACI|nr:MULTISPECIES: hypothetical protein [Bacillus]AGX04551.1 hypothetical protein N288_13245 [Bacillus infantis NRRL B-14911]EAR68383.1 hypothetical protein B14911_27030 [Bacillus sp. NRRL B-14911]
MIELSGKLIEIILQMIKIIRTSIKKRKLAAAQERSAVPGIHRNRRMSPGGRIIGSLIELSGELIKIILQMIEMIRTSIKKRKLAAPKGQPTRQPALTAVNSIKLQYCKTAYNNSRNFPENHQNSRIFSFSHGEYPSSAARSALKPQKKEADEPIKGRRLLSFQIFLYFQIQ